jgi:hypothetical protein
MDLVAFLRGKYHSQDFMISILVYAEMNEYWTRDCLTIEKNQDIQTYLDNNTHNY